MNEIKFIDLFGGIGGFHLGLERANKIFQEGQVPDKESVQNRWDKSNPTSKSERQHRKEYAIHNRSIAHEGRGETKNIQRHSANVKSKGLQRTTFSCVWYCDKDKYATQTYNKNFKTKYKPTDITTVSPETIPDVDMLCAGFPCQSFSVAGKRKGFQDIRGTMFFEIYRIAQAKKPRLLFLENVKGLLSADDGRCFATILSSLDELGYDCEWQVLNSKNFGVPQNRERVFIVGHLRGKSGEQVFPVGEIHEEHHGAEQKAKKSRSMIVSRSHGFNKGNIKKEPNIRFSSVQNELVIFDGHHHQFTKEMGTLTGRENRKDTNWLVGKKINKIRRLTPVECERLQGFPDNWTEGVSDTQRYKQLGNAVTVNVIKAIGENLN